MSPNTIRTVARYVLGVACLAGVGILTCGCKASGHVDFSIDLPALEPAEPTASHSAEGAQR